MKYNSRAILNYARLLDSYATGVVVIWVVGHVLAGAIFGRTLLPALISHFRTRASPLPADDAAFFANVGTIVGMMCFGLLGYYFGQLAALLWRATAYGLVTLVQIESNTRPTERQIESEI